ncbi:MAG TPA: energy-coupling factor transporter ATPase [bacterium]|nr:energy-coupling factor transporter ATPase [bacterium]
MSAKTRTVRARASGGAAQAPPVIRCDRLSHIYQRGTPFEAAAVDDVSLEIRAGEAVGIIGATGSGKSTLVQHFNALLRPTRGRVYLDDVDVHAKEVDRRRVRQQIALLFQYPEHQLFEETVEADVAFGPRNLGLGDDEVRKRVDRALRQVGLDPARFGRRSPFTLSNGEMRRTAIAGLLAMRPRVLILDEPTAGLDPAGRREILGHVARLRREAGLTLVLISHSMDAVASLCERVVVLDRGRLIADGTVRAVFADAPKLVSLGLGVPQAAQCVHRLRDAGWTVRPDVLTVEEARAAILDALRRRGAVDGTRTGPAADG